MILTYLFFAALSYFAYYMYYVVPIGTQSHFREDSHNLVWIAALIIGGVPLLLFTFFCTLITYAVERFRNWHRYRGFRPLNVVLMTVQAVTVYYAYQLMHGLLPEGKTLSVIATMFATVCSTQLVTVAVCALLFRFSLRVGGWKRNLLKFNLMDSIYLSLYVITAEYVAMTESTPWFAGFTHGVVVIAILGLYYWRTVGIRQTQRADQQMRQLQTLNGQLAEANQQVLLAFASSLEKRDPYTAGHSERVAQYAHSIAKELGLSEQDLKIIHLGGLLHDIGKIGIPDSVLNKPDRLTAEEYDVMKQHPVIGEELLRRVYTTSNILDENDRERMLEIVLSHHERPDGRGYPHGLTEDEIPLFARITAVADAFDAMTSNRAYRNAMSVEKAVVILREGSGTQFWEPAVKAFMMVLEREALAEVAVAGEEG